MQCGSGSHRNAADNYRAEAMRLYEGHDISGERANREQTWIAGFGAAMATGLYGYPTETQVAGEGFDRLSRVPAQPVLEYDRQSHTPCVIHIEDRRAYPGKPGTNRSHEMKPTVASVWRRNSRVNFTSISSSPCITRGPVNPLCLAHRR